MHNDVEGEMGKANSKHEGKHLLQELSEQIAARMKARGIPELPTQPRTNWRAVIPAIRKRSGKTHE